MLDVLKTFDFDYLAETCASSFQGLHESVVNYGENDKPEFLTSTHEETSVAIAHGYAKIENKPLLVCATAPSGCSTPRWRSTTPFATACRCS